MTQRNDNDSLDAQLGRAIEYVNYVCKILGAYGEYDSDPIVKLLVQRPEHIQTLTAAREYVKKLDTAKPLDDAELNKLLDDADKDLYEMDCRMKACDCCYSDNYTDDIRKVITALHDALSCKQAEVERLDKENEQLKIALADEEKERIGAEVYCHELLKKVKNAEQK